MHCVQDTDESTSPASQARQQQAAAKQAMVVPGSKELSTDVMQRTKKGLFPEYRGVAQLLAVGNLHKENDDRFVAITQALLQDLEPCPGASSAGMRDSKHHYTVHVHEIIAELHMKLQTQMMILSMPRHDIVQLASSQSFLSLNSKSKV